jgi:hypothetical protein
MGNKIQTGMMALDLQVGADILSHMAILSE